ncbi:MAG TPA: tail fiber protein, partial [Pseudolabrys sp.]|nr:tail fiber protein [Pseudolabrys sp.]
TFYGGNGVSTFALPDLRGRVPICYGQGNGLSNYPIGTQTGSESVSLQTTQIPAHTHMPIASSAPATTEAPGGGIPATLAAPFAGFYVKDGNKTGNPVAMSQTAVQPDGNSFPHENRMPALAISIIIALTGLFPSRN